MNQDALQFGGEKEVLAPRGNVERLDADPVAGKNQALARLGPDGDGKHPAQFLEAAGVPLEKGVEHSFCIAMGLKPMSARRKGPANFEMIVDFAVEDDGGVAIFGKDGLIALGKVNDLEPRRAQTAAWQTGRRPVHRARDGAKFWLPDECAPDRDASLSR